ncbi:MAG: ribosome maturation factor RimP [Chitinophagaceae bacterium]
MKEQIILIAKHIIEHDGFFVVVVKMITKNKIQILVDGERSVSLDLCSQWNYNIRMRIEEEITTYQEGNLELEVSSFGVGEHLVDRRQYAINIGRKITVHYFKALEELTQVEGKLIEVKEEYIVVEKIKGKAKKGIVEIKNININSIKRAIIEVDF